MVTEKNKYITASVEIDTVSRTDFYATEDCHFHSWKNEALWMTAKIKIKYFLLIGNCNRTGQQFLLAYSAEVRQDFIVGVKI